MLRSPKQVIDGLGFAANTALGLGKGLKDEVKLFVNAKINQKLASMDLVTRAEYDELRAMVAKLREEQEQQAAAKSPRKKPTKKQP